MTFATLAKDARKEEGLTQAEAAKLMGVSPKTIFNAEFENTDKPVVPSLETIVKMAVAYKKKGQELLNFYLQSVGVSMDQQIQVDKPIEEIEEEIEAEGFRGKSSTEDELIPLDEMQIMLREIALLRKLQKHLEASRKKRQSDSNSGDTSKGAA